MFGSRVGGSSWLVIGRHRMCYRSGFLMIGNLCGLEWRGSGGSCFGKGPLGWNVDLISWRKMVLFSVAFGSVPGLVPGSHHIDCSRHQAAVNCQERSPPRRMVVLLDA